MNENLETIETKGADITNGIVMSYDSQKCAFTFTNLPAGHTLTLFVNGVAKGTVQEGVAVAITENITLGINVIFLREGSKIWLHQHYNITNLNFTVDEEAQKITLLPWVKKPTVIINGLKYETAVGILKEIPLKNSLFFYGNNFIEITTPDVADKKFQYGYYRKTKILLDTEKLAKFFENQLNWMINDKGANSEKYIYNTPYKVEMLSEIGVAKLKEKALSIKEAQSVPASLNLVQGTVADSTHLDMYSYDLQAYFIATVDTVKSLKERIDTFVYNSQGKTLPIAPLGYSAVGSYALSVKGAPFVENGEERVALMWLMTIDFVKEGVYADDVNWSLKFGEGDFLPMNVISADIGTGYGADTIQENGETNVKNVLLNRSLAWHFNLLYTQSDLTSMLVKNYILPGDSKAFMTPITLHYVEETETETWERSYNVIITSCKYMLEAGKIIGISFDCVEAW